MKKRTDKCVEGEVELNSDTELLFEIGIVKELKKLGFITDNELSEIIEILSMGDDVG